MDGKSPWEPVVRAVLEKIDDVIRERLKAFRDSLDQWLNGILAGPIPDDWPEQLDRFVEETAERGIGIMPHSIDTIARIIESRALVASRSAVQPAARRVHSHIAADGAFVQRLIPNVSGPDEAKHPTEAQPSSTIRINPGDYTAETQQIIRTLGKVWANVSIGAMRQVREAGALVDGPTGAPLGHGSNALGVEVFVRLARKDGRTDTAHVRFVSPLFESAHWEFVELNRGQAPEQGAAALAAREKIRHADVMRVRGASSRFQGGMFAIIGGINGIVEGAPMLGTLEVAGGAEQAALAGADLATGEEHRAWSARGIQAALEAAGVDAETARFLADNGGLLIALGKAAVDAAGTAHAVIETSTGYRIRLDFDPATLSANGLGGAKIKATKVAPSASKRAAKQETAKAADLAPYGGRGGGHHVPAKSAFSGAAGYDAKDALAVSNAELARLGVRHAIVTGAQQVLYRAFAKTRAKLTWKAVEKIETDALIRGNMDPDAARATVRRAIKALRDAGVSEPTRIPWGG